MASTDTTDIRSLVIEYDAKAHSLSIATPGGIRIVVGEADHSVALADQNGNRVRLDGEGIEIDSAGALTLRANGNQVRLDSDGVRLDSVGALTLHAKGQLVLSTGEDVKISAGKTVAANAQHVALTAQESLSAKGAAMAKLASDGQTTIKGALVSIN